MPYPSTARAIREELQRMIGCTWGRQLASRDDSEPCMELASRRVMVYQDGKQVLVQLCPKHLSIVLDESTPHEFDEDWDGDGDQGSF